MDLHAAANQCFESLESLVLDLEEATSSGADSGDLAATLRSRVFKGLGLRCLDGSTSDTSLLLDMIEDGVMPLTPEMIDSLLQIVESQRHFFFKIADSLTGPRETPPAPSASPPAAAPAPDPFEAAMAEMANSAESPPLPDVSDPAAPATSVAPAAPSTPATEEAPSVDPAKKQAKDAPSFLKVDTEKLDALMESVKELLITNTVIVQHPAMMENAFKDLHATVLEQNRVIDTLRDQVVDIRRVSVNALFNRMGRLARETAHGEDKQLEVRIEGQDVELDKSMIDLLGDPMVHLVRNAVDHGVELPDDRTQAGKEAVATVTLVAKEDGDQVAIEISDDGKGLDKQRILAKAKEKGLLNGRDLGTMQDEEIYGLILLPGFSTAAQTTALSGRGVGMDVVSQTIQAMRGELDITSEQGKGSTFRIRVPANHAATEGIASGLEVIISGQNFVIPAKNVLEIIRPEGSEVASVVNQGEVISIRDRTYPLARMASIFQIACPSQPSDDRLVLLVESGGRRKAVLVDDVIGEQQVVVRTFEGFASLFDIRLFSGMALMGDRISVVVNLDAFFVESERDNHHNWKTRNMCDTPREIDDPALVLS